MSNKFETTDDNATIKASRKNRLNISVTSIPIANLNPFFKFVRVLSCAAESCSACYLGTFSVFSNRFLF